MANKFWGFFKGILLKKEASVITYAAENEGAVYNHNNSKLRTHLAGSDRELVTADQTQTLTNKTIDADSNTISNIENADIKAAAAIDASKIHDGSVSNTEFGYLANVTSDIQSQFTGTASAADVADLVTLSGVASGSEDLGTFTGATIPDNSDNKEAFQALETAHEAHVNDSSGAHAASAISNTPSGNLAATDAQAALNELQSDVDTRATSSALTTHTGASTGVHGVTGSVVGTSDAQTLSAKTFSDAVTLAEIATPATPSSGYGKVYFKADGSLYQLSDTGAESKVGSGSGSKNYIANFDGAQGTAGYNTYADAAGVRPVGGSGGSPSVTLAINTSNPLSGGQDFLFSKDAVDRQGQGVSYDFSIDNSDRASVLRITLDYSTSANYVDGDMRVYIFDRNNSRIIEGVPVEIGATAQGHFLAEFQSNPTSTDYRLILHISSTNSAAYTVNFDNVVVGPQSISKGPIVTDWNLYTPTFTGFGTVSGVNFRYKRNGSDLLIKGSFLSGVSTATEARISLPLGLSSVSTTASIESVGVYARGTSTSNRGSFVLIEPSTNYITLSDSSAFGPNSAAVLTKATGDNVASTGQLIDITATVSITGWSSNQIISADAGQRVVCFSARRSGSSQAVSGFTETIVQYNSTTFDSTGSFDTSGYRYVIPESGIYFLTASCEVSASTTDTLNNIRIKKNGSVDIAIKNEERAYNDFFVFANALDNAVKGDYYEVFIQSNDGSYNVVNSNSSYFSGFKLQSAQQFAASSVVAAKYKTNSAQSVVNGAVVNFDDLIYDTHNAVTVGASWKFNAPSSGKYQITTRTTTQSVTPGSSTQIYGVDLYKNGSIDVILSSVPALITSPRTFSDTASATVELNMGEYIDIRFNEDIPTVNLDSSGDANWICIEKIGGIA